MSSGGDSNVEYTQSPEQQQLFQSIMPMVQGMAQYGTDRYFGGAPQMGAPSMSGVLTGQPMYDIPGYNIPNPSSAMPTSDWWGGLAPEVKAGLYAPYVEAGQGLMEIMGSKGQMGSARPGFSGAAGAAMGELAGKAAQNVGLNAWQMTAPMAMANWQAQLGRNQNMWQQDLARNQLGYQQGQQESLGDYNTAMNVWNRPMGLTGMLGMGMPQGMVQQGGGGLGGMFSGGLMGGLGAGMMFPGSWPAIGAGGLLGGIGGFF